MSDVDFRVLGDQVARELLAADTGLSAGYGIQSLAELAQRGVQTYEDKKSKEKSASDAAAAVRKSIAADVAWANAEGALEQAKASKVQTSIDAAQALQTSASSAAAAAGTGLDDDGQAKRLAAANDQASKAATASLGDPKNTQKAAMMHAWQKVAAGASSSATPAAKTEASKLEKEGHSFWTAKHAGVPTWGWFAGGVVVLGGVAALIVKLVRGRKR